MPVNNAQPTLAITQYVMTTGIFPYSDDPTGGPGEGYFTMGMIRNFAGNFDPGVNLFAHGQLLSIAQNSALFSLMGVQYGGDGRTNFALPNLSNRLSVSEGSAGGRTYSWGEVFGSSSFNVAQANLPASSGGTTSPVANEQPSLTSQYIIRLADLYGDAGGAQAGEIVQYAGGRTPTGYFDCDGRALQINEYPELYALLGTTYGGNGVTTFNIPDLRGRSAVGTGGPTNVQLGQQLGAAETGITLANMPVEMGGSGQPVSNFGPSLGLNYLIRTTGIFPSRDNGPAPEDDYYVGEIIIYAGSDVPPGFARCNGTVIPINQNEALFALVGTTYGGDGVTTFGLPNFSGRSSVGYNPNVNQLGDQVGSPTFTVTMADIPQLNINGTGAAETLYGGNQADQINGNDGNDTLVGNGGSDTLNGGQGSDTMTGGAGNDTLNGGLGGDIARYSGNRDRYTVTRIDADSLTITGPDGTDTVNDVETFVFADGTFTFQDIAPPPVPTEGDDVLDGTEDADTIDALGGNDTVNGLGGNDLLIGGAGNDALNGGEGDDVLRGGAGSDALNGGNGVDTADYSTSTTNLNVNLATGVRGGDAIGDTYSSIENLTGGSGTDSLVGDANANVLTGGANNDSLRGGLGVDTLIGGLGGDQYYIDAGDETDIIVEQTGDTGQQDLIFTTLATYTIADNVERLHGTSTAYQTLNGNNLDNVFQKDAAGGYTVNAGGGGDAIFGSSFAGSWDDILNGGDGNDRIYGYSGNDQLNGDAGDDFLYGGTGADAYNGGAGTDYILFDFDFGTTIGVNVNLETGTGTDGFGNVETYSSIEYVFGAALNDQLTGDANVNYLGGAAGDDILSGGGGNDQLIGGIGNDVLDGGLGNDFLLGGAGNDVVVVDSAADIVSEAVGEGTDEVRTTLSTFTLGVTASSTNVENLTGLLATGQTLIGNAGDNVIAGAAGDDILRGGGGADTLNGGDGIDTADYSTSTTDELIFIAGGGTTGDTFNSIENLTSGSGNDNLQGDSGVNVIRGGAGDDRINGFGGADTFIGGTGNDVYDLTSTTDNTVAIVEDIGGGTADQVFTTLASYTLAANVENLGGTSGGAQTLNGNDGNNFIYKSSAGSMTTDGGAGNDIIRGFFNGAFDDVLSGGTGNDDLNGYAGADTLNGGDGDDVIVGGAGNDTLSGGSGTDTLTYFSDGGTLGVTVNLATGIATDSFGDTDTLSGFERVFGTNLSDVLTGGASDDVLDGSGGNDILDGGAGNDRMSGGLGDDIFMVGSALDVVSEAAGQGTDTVITTLASYALAANVENLTGSLGTGQTLTGNTLNNVITGANGNDTLRGGAGADVLNGGSGQDTADYATSSTGVTIDLGANSAIGGDAQGDTFDSIENITGSGFNDTLSGDTSANVLVGGAGDDTLTGSAGNDTLLGGTGNDTAVYLGNRSDYVIVQTGPTTLTITSPDGSHTVMDVETFRFDDGDYAFSALIDSTPPATPAAPDLVSASDTGSSATDNITSNTTPTVTGTTEAGAVVVVYDTDGTTVLGTATADATTGAYTVTLSVLSQGVHNLTVVATDANGNASVRSSALNVTIDTTAPDAPVETGIDVDDGQPGDRITSDNTPTLNGTAEAFATVLILRDGTAVGTVTADADGVWAFNSDTLARGSYVFSSQATDVAGNVGPTTAGITVSVIDSDATPGDDQLQGTTDSDTIASGEGNDEVNGLDGDDTLFGQGGDDILRGGEGDDIVVGGSGNDTLDGGNGIDTADYSDVSSGVRVQLNTGVALNDGDGGTDTLSGFENVTGSAFDDLLIGDDEANTLNGGQGRDVLAGGDGDDTLIGGSGAPNELYGGAGDDTYVLDANDTIVEMAGGGVDTVRASINLVNLAANVENLIFTGTGMFRGNGNTSDNSITGGAGDDILSGGGGNDILIGGGGFDTADFSQASSGIVARLDTGLVSQDGEGGVDTLTDIAGLIGSSFDDLLIGSTGDDILDGGLGRDVLIGGQGNDVIRGGQGVPNELYGGDGDDTFILDANDTIVELTNGGIDTVRASIGVVNLADNVENLIFTGAGRFIGNGNAQDNLIVGGSGDDILSGGGGYDVLVGGLGDDTLYGGSGAANEIYGGDGDDTYVLDADDTIVELASGGIDTVQANIAVVSLADNIENLRFTGTGDFRGIGNGLDNIIIGGSGDDVLTGGGGNDDIRGGAGTDTLTLRGLAADYTVTAENGGYRILDSSEGRDGSSFVTSIERLSFADGQVRLLDYSSAMSPSGFEKGANLPLVWRVLDVDDQIGAKTSGLEKPWVQPQAEDDTFLLGNLGLADVDPWVNPHMADNQEWLKFEVDGSSLRPSLSDMRDIAFGHYGTSGNDVMHTLPCGSDAGDLRHGVSPDPWG